MIEKIKCDESLRIEPIKKGDVVLHSAMPPVLGIIMDINDKYIYNVNMLSVKILWHKTSSGLEKEVSYPHFVAQQFKRNFHSSREDLMK